MRYRWNETGAYLLAVHMGMIMFFAILLSRHLPFDLGDGSAVSLLVAIVLLFCSALLTSTIEVVLTDETLSVRLGIGAFKRRIPLETIESVKVATVPWYGLGIRRIRRGWSFGVATGNAAELVLSGGRRFMIALSAAPELVRLVEDALPAEAEPQHQTKEESR